MIRPCMGQLQKTGLYPLECMRLVRCAILKTENSHYIQETKIKSFLHYYKFQYKR